MLSLFSSEAFFAQEVYGRRETEQAVAIGGGQRRPEEAAVVEGEEAAVGLIER